MKDLSHHFKLENLIVALAIVTGVTICSAKPALATILNVKNYGATGNGTTDDTSAIQAAITAAGAGSGNTVLFPPGTYLYTQELVAHGIEFRGVDRFQVATLLSGTAAAHVQVEGSGTKIRLLRFTDQSNNLVSNAVIVNNAENFYITDNKFDAGFKIWDILGSGGSSQGYIRDNILDTNGVGGIRLSAGNASIWVYHNAIGGQFTADGILSIQCTNIHISANGVHNLASTNSAAGIKAQQDHSDDVGANSVDGASIGLFDSGCAGTLWGSNRVSHSSQFGILAQSSTSPVFTDNIIKFANTAIEISTCSNPTVSANAVSTADNFGIVQSNNTGTVLTKNNILRDCGLHVSASGEAAVFVSCPSATSIPIKDNSYSETPEDTTGLSFFVHCVQPQPPADVSGNRTNTTLPNKIGS